MKNRQPHDAVTHLSGAQRWNCGQAQIALEAQQASGLTVAEFARRHGIRAGRLSSEYCISCHEEAGRQWRGSHHQLANRKIDRVHPAADFTEGTARAFASDYRFALDAGPQPKIEERRRDGTIADHRPSMAIGQSPLRQFLIETKPGTFQVTEIAWDPARQDWFDTFPPTEERNPGEWGHWTGQSMNWT